MSADARDKGGESDRRLQFSLLSLLGVVTGCGVAFGLVAWVGPDLAAASLMLGGFALVLIGSSLRREPLVVCGGIAMIGACVVLIVLGLARVVYA